MCSKPHQYTVEVTGKPVRYAGTSQDEAVSALLTVSPDAGEEGYVVAEHVTGDATSYCPAESSRIESLAIEAGADAEARWQEAVDAFHGDGAYSVTAS